MTPSDFDLPEGIVYYFEGPEAQPSAFLSVCYGVIRSQDPGSGLVVGRFQGAGERFVAVMGPSGTLKPFLEAMARHEDALINALQLPKEVVTPDGHVRHDGSPGHDAARYQRFKQAILNREATLLESGGSGESLSLYLSPPPIRNRGPGAPRADITLERVITTDGTEALELPVLTTHTYHERVFTRRKWYQLKRVQTVERTRTLVTLQTTQRTVHRRVEIRTYRPRRWFERIPGLTFAAIPPGRFVMRLPGSRWPGDGKDGRSVTVELTRAFELQCVPVPQVLYTRLAGRNPSEHKGDMRPVEHVSWYDACLACNRLSESMDLEPAYEIGRETVSWRGPESPGWRLPTEAEWEYACRAGEDTIRPDHLEALAWFRENSDGTTHPVMEKPANPWGLFDMLGNVDEWCWDYYNENYPAAATVNPTGPVESTRKVLRGGSWRDEPWFIQAGRHGRAMDPESRTPWIGFRMARTIE